MKEEQAALVSRKQRILFISDVHLTPSKPERSRNLIALLKKYSNEIDILFIVGDLFDFWFGYKTVIFHHYLDVVFALLTLADQGIQIHYVVGNHDFNLGPIFKSRMQTVIHEHPIWINIDGRRMYVCHGDKIDKKDYGYRILCHFVRSKWTQKLFELLHPDIGWQLAKYTSATSRTTLYKKGGIHRSVYDSFISSKINSGAEIVMHAHTHWPLNETRNIDGKKCLLLNPGDWVQSRSYIYYQNRTFTLYRNFTPEMDNVQLL